MTEDFNDFNVWDCGGAACFMAAVPAVFYFVFGDHDPIGTGILLIVALGIGLFVLVVAYLAGSRVVGRFLQLVGVVLCVGYWAYALHMWRTHNKFSSPEPSVVERPRFCPT